MHSRLYTTVCVGHLGVYVVTMAPKEFSLAALVIGRVVGFALHKGRTVIWWD